MNPLAAVIHCSSSSRQQQSASRVWVISRSFKQERVELGEG